MKQQSARADSRTGPPSSASSASATSACRSRSNSRRPASTSSATTSASASSTLLNARRVAHPGRSGVGSRGARARAACSRRRPTKRASARADAISIAVPTPLSKTRDPGHELRDLRAADGDAPGARPGMLVVLESTTYPGTTREILHAGADASAASRSARTFRRVQPRARRSGQPGLPHEEHAEGRRRHHAGVHRSRDGALRDAASTRSCRCRRRKRRSW